MQSIVMMSFLLFGFCTGEPPVHGTHHEHHGFAQPHPFQQHHENEIAGLQTPKFDSSSYNSLSSKTSGEEYGQYSNLVSNEYGTPRFGMESPRPLSADSEKPDSMYGVPKNQMTDQSTNLNDPPAPYGSPAAHGAHEMSLRNHEDHFIMKEHSANTDFQGYEDSQRVPALEHDREKHFSFTDHMSGHRDFNGLPEVVAARQSVSPLKGAVEGITQAIIRPNSPLKNRYPKTNPSRSHHKSPKSRTLASQKHTAKHSSESGTSQGYPSVPEQWVSKYEQESLQHHLEEEEPSKTYLPTGRNAFDNNVELQEDRGDQNYEFEYRVNDYQSASDFGHRESRQFGSTHGMYHVLLPDGRKQIVEYEADEEGYKPRITYEEPEVDTRDQSGRYDANSNNVERNSQEERHQTKGRYDVKHQNEKGFPQGRSQGPY